MHIAYTHKTKMNTTYYGIINNDHYCRYNHAIIRIIYLRLLGYARLLCRQS